MAKPPSCGATTQPIPHVLEGGNGSAHAVDERGDVDVTEHSVAQSVDFPWRCAEPSAHRHSAGGAAASSQEGSTVFELGIPDTLYAFGVGAMFRALPPTRASTTYQVRSFADLFRRACEGTGKMLPTQGLNVSCQCIYTSPPSHPGAIPFSINSLMASEFFDNSESPMPRRTLAALLNWMFS